MNPLKNKNKVACDYLILSGNHAKKTETRNSKTGIVNSSNIKQVNNMNKTQHLNSVGDNKKEDATFSSSLSLKKQSQTDLSKPKQSKNAEDNKKQDKKIRNVCRNDPQKFLMRNSLFEKQKALKLQLQKRKNLYGVVSDCKFRPNLQNKINANNVSRKQLHQPVQMMQRQKQIEELNLGRYQQNYYKKQNYEKREYLTKIKKQSQKSKDFRQLIKESVNKFNQKFKGLQISDDSVSSSKRKEIFFNNVSISNKKTQVKKPIVQKNVSNIEQCLNIKNVQHSQIQNSLDAQSEESKINQQLKEISVVLQRQNENESINESNLFNISLWEPDPIEEDANKLTSQKLFLQKKTQEVLNSKKQQQHQQKQQKQTSLFIKSNVKVYQENMINEKDEQRELYIQQVNCMLKIKSQTQIETTKMLNFNFNLISHSYTGNQFVKNKIDIVKRFTDKCQIAEEKIQVIQQKRTKQQLSIKQWQNIQSFNQQKQIIASTSNLVLNLQQNIENEKVFGEKPLIIFKQSQQNNDINQQFVLSEPNLLNVSEIVSKPYQIQIEQQSANAYFQAQTEEKQAFIIDDYGNVHNVGYCDILVIPEVSEEDSISEY